MTDGNPLLDQRLLPERSRTSMGPFIGAIIIICMLALGALYFWSAQSNRPQDQKLPLIQGDSTSIK